MLAGTHVACKYIMAVGSHALSGGAYIMAGTHVASRYIMALGWHALSKGTYMSAGMNVASRYITALGWNIFSEVTYMPAHTPIGITSECTALLSRRCISIINVHKFGT